MWFLLQAFMTWAFILTRNIILRLSDADSSEPSPYLKILQSHFNNPLHQVFLRLICPTWIISKLRTETKRARASASSSGRIEVINTFHETIILQLFMCKAMWKLGRKYQFDISFTKFITRVSGWEKYRRLSWGAKIIVIFVYNIIIWDYFGTLFSNC